MQSNMSSVGFLNITDRTMIKACHKITLGSFSTMDAQLWVIRKAIVYVTHMSQKMTSGCLYFISKSFSSDGIT